MMDRIRRLLRLILFPALICITLHADPMRDGGRDVAVALFSTHILHNVTVTPLDGSAWIARCAACAHQAFEVPLKMGGPTELFAGGRLKVADDESRESKSASGLWHFRSKASGIDIVLNLPSERYVAAVLNAEADSGEPAASLQALAIVARTYALNGRHYSTAPGHLAADLCDSTQCQAMHFGPVSQAIEDAVRQTAGETLWFHGKRATVFFSQNCGGITEDAGSVWPGVRNVPYLSSHRDSYCSRRGNAAWHAEIPIKDLVSIAAAQHWRIPPLIDTASIVRRSRSSRALLIEFSGGAARSTVDASSLRFAIDRALGWNQVRSSQYDIAVRHGMLVFDGRGSGHGVGLCQAGATEMAIEHKPSTEILAFYLPGTSVGVAADDHGWLTTHTGHITILSTLELPASRLSEIDNVWKQAVLRFAPHRMLSPEIIFTPSVELFRQMTTQPGWVAASTTGSRMVFAPESTMRNTMRGTLLHEMLHVLVESEATSRVPLWLREGLVEDLAGSSLPSPVSLSASAIEEGLAHPSSQAADERAHIAAAVRVHTMIARYGFSTVRGWLVSGVPAGVL